MKKEKQYNKEQVTIDSGYTIDTVEKLKEELSIPQQELMCPFCLEMSWARDFMYRLKSSGKFARKAECPKCHKNMLLNTVEITSDMDAYTFGKWVAGYPDFFKAIRFEKFTAKLREYKMAADFWKGYRELKPKRDSIEEANKINEEHVDIEWKHLKEGVK